MCVYVCVCVCVCVCVRGLVTPHLHPLVGFAAQNSIFLKPDQSSHVIEINPWDRLPWRPYFMSVANANNQTFWQANTTDFDYDLRPMIADVPSVLRVMSLAGLLAQE